MTFTSRTAGMIASVAIIAASAPAQATFSYAFLGDTAVLSFGGDGTSPDQTLLAGSALQFLGSDPVSFGSFEGGATVGATPSALSNLTIATGAANNGTLFTVAYDRASPSLMAPVGAPGVETGTLEFRVINTVVADVTTGFLQTFTIGGDLEIFDLGGTYDSPTMGFFRIQGNSATPVNGFGFVVTIEIPGTAAVSEPAVLAMIGAGVLAIGVARSRRH